MTSRQNRKARRAAERAARKLRNNDSALSATAGRLDEAAFLSEPKIQENDPAERAARKLRNNDSALSATACLEPSENLETEPGSVSDLAWVKTPSVNEENPISPARLAANRANAQRSTGPTSPTGKATSSKNALKTALTGRTVLLPEDDAERYERHLLEYEKI